MMKVKSTVKINKLRIDALNKATVTALEQTAEALHTEVQQAQVVPRDTGALQNDKMFVDTSQSHFGRVTLVHEGPYARRLYFHPEYNFKTSENPNARGQWFEPWQKGGKNEEFCSRVFKIIYRRIAGL